MNEYLPRIADSLLADLLDAMGIVLVEGPKYCGKTTMSMQQSKSAVFMTDSDSVYQNLALAQTNIKQLLAGATPRLIDEWQIEPKIWDAARNEVDRRGEDGQFILTGSAVPIDSRLMLHSGTGRVGRLKLRTMSLWESGDSSGDVSLERLFDDPKSVEGESSIDIERLAFLACRGGWPKSLNKRSEKSALIQAKEYYKAVVNIDISRVDGVERKPEIADRIMRSYARNQASQASIATILEDIKANDAESVNDNTIASYLSALRKIFVVEDMKAWNPNLRSKSAIRTSDTHFFSDPSIATAALGLGPKDLINDIQTFGLIYEAMAIRDLRVYADYLDGEVYHFRDRTGLECDAVVHLRNGSYGLVEVKIGGEKNIDIGAESLINLAGKIDTDKMKSPSFMMVLTGIGQYAYKRPDGVLVVPIGCLKN